MSVTYRPPNDENARKIRVNSILGGLLRLIILGSRERHGLHGQNTDSESAPPPPPN